MKLRRFIPVLLALILTLSACSTSSQESETTADEPDISDVTGTDTATDTDTDTDTNTQTWLKDAVPAELDFGGADFIILAQDGTGGKSLVDGYTADVYNDAIYDTELYAEDRLNVNISEVISPDILKVSLALVDSGDTTYDTFSMVDRWSVNIAMEGALYPMCRIPYVDLDQYYWGDLLSDSLSIAGQHFFSTSSFNLYSLERTACLLFNETVAADHGIEIPFADVFARTWTLDKLASYAKVATHDLNGDGVMDLSDSYTFGSMDYRDTPEKFLCASGVQMVELDENGLPDFTLLGNERLIDCLERIRRFFYDDDTCEKAPVVNSSELFLDDREMITASEFRYMSLVREMKSDFSILPLPKYDETQENYYSYTSNVIFTMVPVTATDLDKAGAVLEVLCCAGYNRILPAYIESSMMHKIARNAESAKAIRIIFDSRMLDIAKMYKDDLIGQIYTRLLNETSVVTLFENQRSKIDGRLEDVIDALTAVLNEQ